MTGLFLALLLALAPSHQGTQTPRDARATITVVDQTGAIIQNATVTATPIDAGKSATAGEQKTTTNEKGIATIENLAPGRYKIVAEFPGFETRLLPDIRLKSGDNKHVAVLNIQGLQDSVTVSRDKQEAASDRRATFGTALTREQIDALSDDPDEMAQQLQDMAGGNAVIRVDSFEGGRLPSKSAIKSIHITRDAFAAENHSSNGFFIDIITQPGVGPLRTNFNTRVRDGSLSGAPPSAFATAKGPERTQSYNGGIGGSLIKQKASFNVNVNGTTSFDTPYFGYVPSLGSAKVVSLAPRRPRDNVFVFSTFDYAVTKDQTVRAQFFSNSSKSRDLGVGGVNMLDRGYSSDNGDYTLRLQEAGPLGRRFFTNTRASIDWSHSSNHSLFETPTIVVLDAFTDGGQQLRGSTHSKTINFNSDLDYVRGMHSFRTGVELDGGAYHSNAESNYLGTYTFSSLEAYAAGTPMNYSIRQGNPNIDYWNFQAAGYVQDDIRVRKGLTFSPGVRYEAQTHLSDYNNFGPRFGVTWAPGKGGKTTLRASAGVFYDWLSTNTYEQTLQVDGVRQRELNIADPTTFPIVDPSGLALSDPTNKYLLAGDLQMVRTTRFSGGVQQQINRMISANVLYQHTTGIHVLRGDNLNPPVLVDGAPLIINNVVQRADPNFSNVIEVLDDARSRADSVNIGATVNFNVPKSGPANGSGGPIMMNGGGMIMMIGGPQTPTNVRWNWRRMNIFTNMVFGRSLNDSDGAFSTPATGSIANDWGPAAFDVRRRLNVGWSSQQLRNFNMNLMFNASSAAPYSIRTGTDANGDGLFNDRPADVGRNSVRGSGQWSVNSFFTYFWQFGKPVAMPGGISLRSDGGALSAAQTAGQSVGRYRLSLNVNVQNLTNHANLSGYVGTLSSNLFGKPQSAFGTRKVDIGLGLSF
jgi:hypothetical protein